MNNFNLLAKLNPNAILKHLPVAALVIDSQGSILWANENAAAMFESPKSLLKKHTIDELVINGLESIKSASSKD